jgi:hypothetical protein
VGVRVSRKNEMNLNRSLAWHFNQFLKIEAMEENAKGLDKKQTVLKATGKKRCNCCNCDKKSNLL